LDNDTYSKSLMVPNFLFLLIQRFVLIVNLALSFILGSYSTDFKGFFKKWDIQPFASSNFCVVSVHFNEIDDQKISYSSTFTILATNC
jgi:hypothetical protein